MIKLQQKLFDIPILKKCTDCGNEKPATNKFFSRNPGKKDTLQHNCKICANEYQKKYYRDNKEAIIIQRKQYIKNNKEKLRAQRQRHYQANKKQICAKTNEYRKANKEIIAERSKRYYKTTNGIYKTLTSGRKYAIRISRQEFSEWYESQPKICTYCDIPEEFLKHIPKCARRTRRLSIDKLDPSGFYKLGNITLCCYGCNCMKNNLLTPKTARMAAQRDIKPMWQKIIASIDII